METKYFIIEKIDGDYAYLKRTDKEEDDLFCVARALLPMEIYEGTKIMYENLIFTLI